MEADVAQRQRRARVVCHRCHRKKIRCDLQRAGDTCTACRSAATACEFRPSHKGHRRKKDSPDGEQLQDDIPSVGLSKRPAGHQAYQPSSQLTYIPANESNYIRALLGHQSEVHSNGNATNPSTMVPSQANDNFMPGIMRNYLETFADICYPWCPILDVDDSITTTGCVLLDHSLAAVASMVRPSLMPGLNLSIEHYERARHLFHAERQYDALMLIKTALLLSCCENDRLGSPTDSSFWWLGLGIRLAQSMRLHRAARSQVTAHNLRLQRRVWWTLFARERVIALCQGRPCLIDETDCTLGLPQTSDFPGSRSQDAHTFINWVSLSRIMGEVNKQMAIARQNGVRAPTQDVAASLIAWLQALPTDLQLSIQEVQTVPFVRDIHLLHLPYLTTIALMGLVNLNTNGEGASEIPVASVVAAGCTARLIGDILLRGCINALPEDASWFITIAINALLHIRPRTPLAKHAASDIHVLCTALEHLGGTWSSAKVLAAGVDKLMKQRQNTGSVNGEDAQNVTSSIHTEVLQIVRASDAVPLADLFPFTSPRTSPLIETILTDYPESCPQVWSGLDLDEYFNTMWNDLFAGQPDLAEVQW